MGTSAHPTPMPHYRHWSASFASYFTIMGLWTAFGPTTMMAVNPQAAPAALACMTLAYFVATPMAHRVWQWLGFAHAVRLMGSCVLALLALAAIQPSWLVWCVPLAFVFGSGTYTVCETRLLEDLAEKGRGHDFGRARKWGSLGFLVAATVGGAVFSMGGMARTFTLALACCAVVYWLCCLALSRTVAAHARTVDAASLAPGGVHSVPQHTPAAPPRAVVQDASTSDTRRNKRIGCAAVACVRVAEAISTTWFGAYWLHTGHSPLETGVLCAVPVAAEFLAMWKGGPWMARYSAAAMMLICCAASVLRWAATPFCTELWCALPLQGIHAFTFGFFYPASLLWLKQSFGNDFFQIRYATESAARALTATVTFAAAGWAIAALGYGAIYAVSLVLTVASGLWWWRCVRVPPRLH